ncbi:MAG: flagellar export protein FliJ [Verrucomicrobiota bacterium]|nr:flagellar export protein FliJ [Verrucomicrobiota bacterium]
MKPFNFSLKTVLEVRSNEEQQASDAYAKARGELETVQLHWRALDEAMDAHLSACRGAFDGQAQSGDLAQLQGALRSLRLQLAELEPELLRLQGVMDEKWQRLLEARQQREAIDKLREKKQALHQREQRRTEQDAVDEMVLLREAAGVATKI